MSYLQQKITQLQNQIHYLEQGLKFADGRAWQQDRDRIRALNEELVYWKKFTQYEEQAA